MREEAEERTASLALRDGEAGTDQDARLSGTAATADCTAGIRSPWPPTPSAASRGDTAAGKDALLTCDTTEMADALNQRIHHERPDTHAPAVTSERGGIELVLVTLSRPAATTPRSTYATQIPLLAN